MKKNNIMKLLGTTAVSLIFVAGMFFVPTNAEAATCKTACLKFRTCVVGHWSKLGKKLSSTQKRKVYGGCMKTCKKSSANKAKVNACYTKSSNTCQSYWACVKKAYKK